MISADAVLFPTRRIDDPKWFPAGPPAAARGREAFTREQRVHHVPGVPSPRWQASPAPEVWLSSVVWEGSDAPPVEWFTSAASAFLEKAYARLEGPPICGRQLPPTRSAGDWHPARPAASPPLARSSPRSSSS